LPKAWGKACNVEFRIAQFHGTMAKKFAKHQMIPVQNALSSEVIMLLGL
tara:strand:- start:425 stop:571 length:147 start_codon:yes stop_codon:yes gene_type:complete